MTPLEIKRQLINDIYRLLEQNDVDVSPMVRKALRLADICNDLEHRMLFDLHLDGYDPDENSGTRVQPWPNADESPRWDITRAFYQDRAASNGQSVGIPLDQIELRLRKIPQDRERLLAKGHVTLATPLIPLELDLATIIGRIRNRVGSFVRQVEREILSSSETTHTDNATSASEANLNQNIKGDRPLLGHAGSLTAPSSHPVTVLFIAGDRGGGQRNQIQIPREFESVDEAIRGSAHRGAFNVAKPILAVTYQKLAAAYRVRAAILHFAGHGDDRSLSFISDQGLLVSNIPVIAEQLAAILSNFPDRIRLCVLNTCDSTAIAQHLVTANVVDAAVGWPNKLNDAVAIAFSRVLYGCLGDGLTLSQAVTLATKSCGSEDEPVLHTNAHTDPNTFTFIERNEI